MSFERFVFIDENKNEYAGSNWHNEKPSLIISEKLLEDPVMVVYLKDSGTAPYNQVLVILDALFSLPMDDLLNLNWICVIVMFYAINRLRWLVGTFSVSHLHALSTQTLRNRRTKTNSKYIYIRLFY